MTSDLNKPRSGGDRKPVIMAAIPCFNEERFIGSVVLKAKKHVDKVLVIDDGSVDSTSEIAGLGGAAVQRHRENEGKGVAIRTALRRCREEKADVLVVLDGDGQHDPNDIPRVVKPILDGEADVVVGSRFAGEGRRPPFYRRLGQHFLTMTGNVGSRTKVTDSQSGFRAFSAKAVDSLNLSENGFAVESEIQFAAGQAGLRVLEVPIQACYADRAKRNPVGHGLSVFSRVLVLLSLRQPMVLFGVPGLLLLGGGLALGLRVMDIWGKTSQLAIGTMLGAILLCLVGVLALFAALMLQSMKELLRGQWERFERTATRTLEDDGEG